MAEPVAASPVFRSALTDESPSYTARLYQGMAVVTVAVLGVAAFGSFVAATRYDSSTERLRSNDGPVLVATQSVAASFAEAEAAATTGFVAGPGRDSEQRRLYDEAIDRALTLLERISARAGADPGVHETLADLSVAITRFASFVEAARATQAVGGDGVDRLLQALSIADVEVRADLEDLTGQSQRGFAAEQSDTRSLVGLAGLLGLALIVLGAAQVMLVRRSRRLLNPPLVVASVATLVALVWLWSSFAAATDELDRAADDGFGVIELTAQIQQGAFGAQSRESVGALTDDGDRLAEAARLATVLVASRVTPLDVASARAGGADGTGLLFDAVRSADTPRERAIAAELLARWQRYRDAAGSGAQFSAVADRFNGFNFMVEALLAENQARFLGGLEAANREVDRLPSGLIALMAFAAVAALAGFAIRLREYR